MRELVADRGRVEGAVLAGWGALWLAIALNVGQVFLLDKTAGLREPALLPIAVGGFLGELALFARALRCLSPVIAYAAYGTTPAIVTVLSVTFFGEALTLPKLVGVGVVTAGVVLLATDRTAAPRACCAEHVARSQINPRPQSEFVATEGARHRPATATAIEPKEKDLS